MEAEYKEAFDLYDDNDDGFISVENIGVVLQSAGVKCTQMKLEDMKAQLSHKQKLNFSEFMECVSSSQKTHPESAHLLENFKIFDIDGNGHISKGDLMKVMTNLGVGCNEAEVEQIIKEADTEGNGNINYHEFLKLMTL